MNSETLKNIISVASNIDLEQTCGACPEAYNVIFDGNHIGNLRLRHGYFSATMKDGAVVYESNPNGDGIFTMDERETELTKAKEAMIMYIVVEGICDDI